MFDQADQSFFVNWAAVGTGSNHSGPRPAGRPGLTVKKQRALERFVEFSLLPHLVAQLPVRLDGRPPLTDRREALLFLEAEMHKLYASLSDWPEKERLH